VDIDAELEARVSYLVLKSETYELGLMMAESASKVSGSLETDSTAAMFNVAEVGARDAKALSELSEALPIPLANGGQSSAEGQRAFHQFFQVGGGGVLAIRTRAFSSHVC
jgi:hypothetical protein